MAQTRKNTIAKKSKKLSTKSSFSKRQFTLYMLAFAVVGAFTLWVSFAAPHNGDTKTGTSSLTGPVMVTDLNSDGLPNKGDSITFNVSTTATSLPQVGLRCYQGTSYVFDAYVGYFPGYLFNKWFTLSSNYWQNAAAATCHARLFY
jgi:hypothetical protein